MPLCSPSPTRKAIFWSTVEGYHDENFCMQHYSGSFLWKDQYRIILNVNNYQVARAPTRSEAEADWERLHSHFDSQAASVSGQRVFSEKYLLSFCKHLWKQTSKLATSSSLENLQQAENSSSGDNHSNSDLESSSFGSDIKVVWQQQLFKAIQQGHPIADIAAIIEGDGDQWVHWVNSQGFTPLHVAVGAGNLQLAKICLAKGADINAKDVHGWTPLHIGARNGDLDMCEVFAQDPNIAVLAINKDGTLPFHYMVRINFQEEDQFRFLKVLETLLRKGTPINAQTKYGETPLHQAVLEGHEQTVRFLIDRGAMLNIQNRNGETPLHYAVKRGHKVLVSMLVENGADGTLGGVAGSAVDLANTREHREIYYFLLGCTSNNGSQSERGNNSMHPHRSASNKPSHRDSSAGGSNSAPQKQLISNVTKLHAFQQVTLSGPTWCSYCKYFIWGIRRQAYNCSVCGYIIHSKCKKMALLSENCEQQHAFPTLLPPPPPLSSSSASSSSYTSFSSFSSFPISSSASSSISWGSAKNSSATSPTVIIGSSSSSSSSATSTTPSSPATTTTPSPTNLSNSLTPPSTSKASSPRLSTHRHSTVITPPITEDNISILSSSVVDEVIGDDRSIIINDTSSITPLDSNVSDSSISQSDDEPIDPFSVMHMEHFESLKPAQLEKLYNQFNYLDHDQRGYIDQVQFRRCLGPIINDSVLADLLFSVFDTNKDSRIDIRDYFMGMSILFCNDLELQMRFAFSMMDTDNSGYVTHDEVYTVMEAVSRSLKNLNLELNTNVLDFVSNLFPQSVEYLTLANYKESVVAYILYAQSLGMLSNSKPGDDNNSNSKFAPGPTQAHINNNNINNHTNNYITSNHTHISTYNPRSAITIGCEHWEIAQLLIIGIRKAVGEAILKTPSRPLKQKDFDKQVDFRITNTYDVQGTTFKDTAPLVFHRLREQWGISPKSYMYSLGPERVLGNAVFLGIMSALCEMSSTGRSGSMFFKSNDGKYLLKTITLQEELSAKSSLPDYYNHVTKYKNSLLTRILGIHMLGKAAGIQDTRFLVMANIFDINIKLHEQYDLKGSTIGRHVEAEGGDGGEQADTARKDLDFHRKLNIGPEKKAILLEQLEHDCKFLEQHNFCDYSFLVGIHKIAQDNNGTTDNSNDTCTLVNDNNSSNSNNNCESSNGNSSSTSIKSSGDGVNSSRGTTKEELNYGNGENESIFRNPYQHGGVMSADGREIYYLAIIDTLTTWDFRKKSEKTFKSLFHNPNELSALPPAPYRARFQKYIYSILE